MGASGALPFLLFQFDRSYTGRRPCARCGTPVSGRRHASCLPPMAGDGSGYSLPPYADASSGSSASIGLLLAISAHLYRVEYRLMESPKRTDRARGRPAATHRPGEPAPPVAPATSDQRSCFDRGADAPRWGAGRAIAPKRRARSQSSRASLRRSAWTDTARVVEEFRIVKRNIMFPWQSPGLSSGGEPAAGARHGDEFPPARRQDVLLDQSGARRSPPRKISRPSCSTPMHCMGVLRGAGDSAAARFYGSAERERRLDEVLGSRPICRTWSCSLQGPPGPHVPERAGGRGARP